MISAKRAVSWRRELKTHDFDPTCPFQLPYRCATAVNMMGAPEAHGARGAPWRGWNRCPYRFRSAGSRRSGPAAHGWSSASSYNPASELSLYRGNCNSRWKPQRAAEPRGCRSDGCQIDQEGHRHVDLREIGSKIQGARSSRAHHDAHGAYVKCFLPRAARL